MAAGDVTGDGVTELSDIGKVVDYFRGSAVLDEAAIKIVRMAAPYSPFPAELRATTDKLEIIRTWQFQQNQLSSNQGAGPMAGAL